MLFLVVEARIFQLGVTDILAKTPSRCILICCRFQGFMKTFRYVVQVNTPEKEFYLNGQQKFDVCWFYPVVVVHIRTCL